MAWITPKTDWVSGDTYEYSDFNRVENNTEYLATELAELVTPPTLGGVITDRTIESLDFYDSLNRIEENILALKNSFSEPPDWETPNTNWQGGITPFNYRVANRLEKNLEGLYEMMANVKASFRYCGTFNAGNKMTKL